MSGKCWVCGSEMAPGQASVPARGVPHRLRAFEGKSVHLRCHGEWNGLAPPAVGPKPLERTSALVEGKRLFAEDLAAMRRISVRQARRWLIQLERRFGVAVVGRIDGRRGPRRFTTATALETIGPRVDGADTLVHERLAELESRVEQLESSRRSNEGAGSPDRVRGTSR